MSGHRNKHRKGKYALQVMLTAEEKHLLDIVKSMRKVDSNKSLLVTFLKEDQARFLFHQRNEGSKSYVNFSLANEESID